jgi:2,5-diketo-D-gluconate reductase A
MTDPSPKPVLPEDTAAFDDGGRMPLLGFGTWQLRGQEAVDATTTALDVGYRHIDTATVYGNEGEVGQALSVSDVPRGDVFLTTKCLPDRAGRELETLRRSLDLLGTDHVDLWLIHAPADDAATRLSMWRAFMQARESGMARNIGVSNFAVEMIDELGAAGASPPAVNQIEWSPLLFDVAVLREHRDRGVVVEGYSALRGGTLDHPTILQIADTTGRTPAQVIIRWHLQHDVVVIPKSRNAERIRSNADVAGFELSAGDMTALDELGRRS